MTLVLLKSCGSLENNSCLPSLLCLQVTTPTTTSSETFHTWPQTTPRSSNAAAQTPKLNQPPHLLFFTSLYSNHVFGKKTRKKTCKYADTSAHMFPWLPATCSVIAQLVLTSEGDERAEQWSLCASTSAQNNCARVGTLEQLYQSSRRCLYV